MTKLLDLVAADAGAHPRRVAVGKDGPEYAVPCPSCGGRDRFHVWPEKTGGKVPGRWWCRGCGKRGDALAYLTEFRGATFLDACALLGVDAGRPARVPRSRRAPTPAPDPLAARECEPAAVLWQTKAAELAAWAEVQLWSDAGAPVRAYLASRGLTEETMRRYRIGWIPTPMFCARSEWGLPEELREDGKPRKLLISPGVLIPCRDNADRLVRLRVRYWTADHASTPPEEPGQDKAPPKYRNVRGSEMRALTAGDGPAAVVVESDLDALLLAQDAGDLVAAVALGSVDVRPDAATAELLRAARMVLVALDSDDAGARAAWGKWRHATNAEVWPVPSIYGKDPGEARGKGYDLRAWVLAGLRYAGWTPGSPSPAAEVRVFLGHPTGHDQPESIAPQDPVLSRAAGDSCPTKRSTIKGEEQMYASWHKGDDSDENTVAAELLMPPTESQGDENGLRICQSCRHRRWFERYCSRHRLARVYDHSPADPCPLGLGSEL